MLNGDISAYTAAPVAANGGSATVDAVVPDPPLAYDDRNCTTQFSETGDTLLMQIRFQTEFVNKGHIFLLAAFRHVQGDTSIIVDYQCIHWWRLPILGDYETFRLNVNKKIEKELSLVYVVFPKSDRGANISPKIELSRELLSATASGRAAAGATRRKNICTAYLADLFNGFAAESRLKPRPIGNVYFGRLAVYNSFSRQWNPKEGDAAWMQMLMMRKNRTRIDPAYLEMVATWDGLLPVLADEEVEVMRRLAAPPLVEKIDGRKRRRGRPQRSTDENSDTIPESHSSDSIEDVVADVEDEPTGADESNDEAVSPRSVRKKLAASSSSSSVPSPAAASSSSVTAPTPAPAAPSPSSAASVSSPTAPSVSPNPSVPTPTNGVSNVSPAAQTPTLTPAVFAKPAAPSPPIVAVAPAVAAALNFLAAVPREALPSPAAASSQLLPPPPPPPPPAAAAKQTPSLPRVVPTALKAHSTRFLNKPAPKPSPPPGTQPIAYEMIRQEQQKTLTATPPPPPPQTHILKNPQAVNSQMLLLRQAEALAAKPPPPVVVPLDALNALLPNIRLPRLPQTAPKAPPQQTANQFVWRQQPAPKKPRTAHAVPPPTTTTTTSASSSPSSAASSARPPPFVMKPPLQPHALPLPPPTSTVIFTTPPPPQQAQQQATLSSNVVLPSQQAQQQRPIASPFVHSENPTPIGIAVPVSPHSLAVNLRLENDSRVHLRAVFNNGVTISPMATPRVPARQMKAMVEYLRPHLVEKLRSMRSPILTEEQAKESVIAQCLVPTLGDILSEWGTPSAHRHYGMYSQPSGIRDVHIAVRDARIRAHASAAVATSIAGAIDKELKLRKTLLQHTPPPSDTAADSLSPMQPMKMTPPPNASSLVTSSPAFVSSMIVQFAPHVQEIDEPGAEKSLFERLRDEYAATKVAPSHQPRQSPYPVRPRMRSTRPAAMSSHAKVIDLTGSDGTSPTQPTASSSSSSSSASPHIKPERPLPKGIPLESLRLVHAASHVPLSEFDRKRSHANPTSEFEMDESWRLRVMHEHLDEFMDISDEEKQYLKMWNEFVWSNRKLHEDEGIDPDLVFPKKLNHVHIQLSEMPQLICIFVQKHLALFRSNDILRLKLIQHLTTLVQLSYLSPEAMRDAFHLLD